MAMTVDDLERHKRHIMLKEIGGAGVQKLQAAHVCVVGAGALGGPCALYLAAAGVGHIELWDDDRVSLSNLQRQIQFGEKDIDRRKTDVLAERLRAINSGVKTSTHPERFDAASQTSASILIDASDNFPTRFMLNEVAHRRGKLLVSGAAGGWQGQVSVYASGVDATAPCYRCFVPEAPANAETCEDMGVVGAVTGMVGSAMALESIKLITGAGKPLIGVIALIDGLSGQTRQVRLRPDTECQVCGG